MIARGRTIYQARCAACHNARQPGTPTRADLRAMPRQRITYAMLTGVMKPMASGMSRADAENVARFLNEGP
jgi:polyvinyl alcohol dehydrogenase (cytochrome)